MTESNVRILAEVDTLSGKNWKYDFRAYIQDLPLIDLKIPDEWFQDLGDGPELIQRLKKLVIALSENEDLLGQILEQKFRQEVYSKWNFKISKYEFLLQNIEIRFLL